MLCQSKTEDCAEDDRKLILQINYPRHLAILECIYTAIAAAVFGCLGWGLTVTAESTPAIFVGIGASLCFAISLIAMTGKLIYGSGGTLLFFADSFRHDFGFTQIVVHYDQVVNLTLDDNKYRLLINKKSGLSYEISGNFFLDADSAQNVCERINSHLKKQRHI